MILKEVDFVGDGWMQLAWVASSCDQDDTDLSFVADEFSDQISEFSQEIIMFHIFNWFLCLTDDRSAQVGQILKCRPQLRGRCHNFD